ncbi:MAG: bifunctional phosphopantothenoylcysteine decarboxylase/phosphopantothenate--cysteine ligase CoaBC [Rhodobacteraceae bacterium]|nr:bifunctional phosphopantothenoylcysteine decarboxylase/phosphopantothenate--cysteine ligase CoaBC [Paracoccaceae bacterium]
MRVLLIIGGGISAYKSLELIRLLTVSEHSVMPVLTRAGAEFVTPLSLAALASAPVRSDLFDSGQEAVMDHIRLSRESDVIAVAPATADLLAKMAHGHADDLASTILLATDKPVLVAPAMNLRMWEHPATVRNVQQLMRDGVNFTGPDEGAMACGEFGPGRMSEPEAILRAITATAADSRLKGYRFLVTSGPTWEPIDPVRVITNNSSGRQGSEIARALLAEGAEVVFITGPAATVPPPGATVVNIRTAAEMMQAVRDTLPVDAAVFAAAVSDWKVVNAGESKFKKQTGTVPTLRLAETEDILAMVSQLKDGRPRLVIGFAAETENIVENATLKRRRKGCDWIVANDVSTGTEILGGRENQITLITADETEHWPRMSKSETACLLVQRIVRELTPQ